MCVVSQDFLRDGVESPLAAEDDYARDHQREGVVVFLGVLAQFLPSTDPKIASTVDALLGALHTPSEAVQRACALCLPSLVKHIKDSATSLIPRLMSELLTSDAMATRRGAAFGLAGCIKGFGIACLKSNDVMTTLEESAQGKSKEARQVHPCSCWCSCSLMLMLMLILMLMLMLMLVLMLVVISHVHSCAFVALARVPCLRSSACRRHWASSSSRTSSGCCRCC